MAAGRRIASYHRRMVNIPSCEQGVDRIGVLIASIWRDVLGTAPVDETNFLGSGGDSLLATRLILRLNERFGVKLSPRAVFEAPTLRELSARVLREVDECGCRVSDEQPDLSSNEAAALSFSQERMWFMHALAAESAAYNIPLALRLRGALDVRRLEAALQQLVERHAMLSTSFSTTAVGPRAQPQRGEAINLAEAHVQVPDGSDSRVIIDRRLAELTGEPFDLERGPLLRLTLLHVARDDAVLLMVMHHIITDQWSLDVLCHDLAQAYRASSSIGSGSEAPLWSYERYSAWHREWFTRRRLPKELIYWRNQIAGLEPVVLTADHNRPPSPSFRGSQIRVPLDPRDLAMLTNLGARHRASLAMVLLGALNVLLCRHTGRTDIAVGVPVANRHHPGSENLVGVLVNTLVARTSLKGNPDFRTVLQRTRAVMLDMFDHQDMPFELLVRELQLSRDGNHSPLFSVMFNMLNTPSRTADFGDVACSRFSFDRQASQFDLTVTIDAVHDGSICFEYSTDVFERATVERLALHYVRILRSVVEDVAAPISTLSMLTEDELELLSDWGRGPTVDVRDQTLTQLLESALSRVPNAVALRFGEESFTYGALNVATERVAHALRSRGHGRGTRVGIFLWRSPLTVIAQLAILRAGAAYVPIDTSYPPERIAYMLRDSGARAIVSTKPLIPVLLRSETKAELVDIESILDADRSQQSSEVEEILNLPVGASPQDAAYVIYTSGSTGKPKGVEVSHRSVVNFLCSMASTPGIEETDRLLAVTTLSFDISVLELLLPLAVGAEVIIASREQLADGVALAELIRTAKATVMQATPSTWRMLIDSSGAGFPDLRALVGGEPLTRELATDLLDRCRELWNMYGPTETTVWSICWRVDPKALDRISIGRPIANTCIHVLDANLQPVPIGAAGELFIGGGGVAIGYLNKPELTAERFLPDPFCGDRGHKLYRSGDRARWRQDGSLEHLGRLDSQVKIRGHRIELGEIETRLAAHPEVVGVVACVAEDDRGDACIVAYVVPRAHMLEPGTFRSYLQGWLPSYMVPQYFIELDAIPLLPNGKIDRVGLANASTEVRKARVTVPPRNRRETAIHRVWSEVLANSEFGVHDSFFDLGGHSLLAVRVAARISAEIGVPCALPMLFRFPTIAALAAALAPPAQHASDHSLVALQPLGEGPPVFCISGVELYQPFADRLGSRFPVYALFSPAEAKYWAAPGEAALTPVSQLAADYLSVVRAQRPSGPYVLIGFSFGGVVAYELAQQLAAVGEAVPLLVILDSDPPRLDGSSPVNNPLSARSIRTGTRALLELGSRFGNFGRLNDGKEAGEPHLRRQRYLAAMRSYRAHTYSGRALFIETTEGRTYDPGHGWDTLIPRIDVHQVSSTHLEIFEPPHIDVWTAKVRALLDAMLG